MESTWDALKSIAVMGFTLQHLLYKMLSNTTSLIGQLRTDPR
jgi:hypothetical protein